MKSDSEFFTVRGYNLQEQKKISDAMEDYLEMIFRQTQNENFIRLGRLATLLNVKPSSASKMVSKLRDAGMIVSETYGMIRLTERGEEAGAYLLLRHNILHKLLCMINSTENELTLTEKIEHHFDARTVENIKRFLAQYDR